MYENDPMLKEYIRFCFLSRMIGMCIQYLKKVIKTLGEDQIQSFLPHPYKSCNYGTIIEPTYLKGMYAWINSTMAEVSQERQKFARNVLRKTLIPFPGNDVVDALTKRTYLLQKYTVLL